MTSAKNVPTSLPYMRSERLKIQILSSDQAVDNAACASGPAPVLVSKVEIKGSPIIFCASTSFVPPHTTHEDICIIKPKKNKKTKKNKKKKFRLLTFIPIVTKFLEQYIAFTVFSAHKYFRTYFLSLAACATRNGICELFTSPNLTRWTSSVVVPDVFQIQLRV